MSDAGFDGGGFSDVGAGPEADFSDVGELDDAGGEMELGESSLDAADVAKDTPEESLGDLTKDLPEDDLGDLSEDLPEDDLGDLTKEGPGDLTEGLPEEGLGDLTEDIPAEELGDLTKDETLKDSQLPEKEPDAPVAEVEGEKTYTDPRHAKGAELEEGYHDYLEEQEGITVLSRHGSVTEPGFDDVYYDEKTGRVTVVEDKNYGDVGRPGYVSEVSAWREDHWNNNTNKTLEAIEQSDLSDDMKDKMTMSILNGDVDRELVIGPNTRISDAKLEQNEVGKLVQFDPASGNMLRVR